MIDPVFLEVSVVVLGIFLLMAEAFGLTKQKSTLAWWAIGGLAAVFIGTFLIGPNANSFEVSGFYVVDGLSLFFKRFVLISTILVLVMSVDYLPIVQRLVPAERPGAGSGEFFILPVFTCAGLMWLVPAQHDGGDGERPPALRSSIRYDRSPSSAGSSRSHSSRAS